MTECLVCQSNGNYLVDSKTVFCGTCFHIQNNVTHQQSVEEFQDMDSLGIMHILTSSGIQFHDKKILYIHVSNSPRTSEFHNIYARALDINAPETWGESVRKIVTQYKDQVDMIVNRHVLNYCDNPQSIICGLHQNHSIRVISFVMAYNFKVQSSFSDCRSYFSTNSLKMLCENNGLSLVDVSADKEFVYAAETAPQNAINIVIKPSVVHMLVKELDADLYSEDTYIRLQLESKLYMNTLQNILLYFKLHGYKIINVFNKHSRAADRMIRHLISCDAAVHQSRSGDVVALMHDNTKYIVVVNDADLYMDIYFEVMTMLFTWENTSSTVVMLDLASLTLQNLSN